MTSKFLRRLLAAAIALPLAVPGLTTPAHAAPQDTDHSATPSSVGSDRSSEAARDTGTTTRFTVANSDSFKKFELVASNPNNPEEKIELKPYESRVGATVDEYRIPDGWVINGSITMKRWTRIGGTGSGTLTPDDFEISAIQEGYDIYFVYTLNNFKPRGDIAWIHMSFTPIDFATYHMYGGTWTDEFQPPADYNLGWGANTKNIYLMPGKTVYKPTDPTRDAHFFMGWYVTSSLSDEAQKTKTPKKFPIDGYQFDEIVRADLKIQQNLVHLYAVWAQIVPHDQTITVGDSFDPQSLIDSAKDNARRDLRDQVEIVGDYDPNTPGTYNLKLAMKGAKNGEPVPVTLTVLPRPEDPTLDVKNVEIWEGEPFKLSDMIVNTNGTAVPDLSAEFNSGKAGEYPVTFTVTNTDGTVKTETAKLIVKKRPDTHPQLDLTDLQIMAGDKFDLSSMIVSSDGTVMANPYSQFDANTPGTYQIEFTATDEADGTTTKTANLVVTPKPEQTVSECVCPPTDPKDPGSKSKPSRLPATGSQGWGGASAVVGVASEAPAATRRGKNQK